LIRFSAIWPRTSSIRARGISDCKTSTPSDEALQALRDKGLVEAGTRTVKAFRDKDGTVVGVYLLTPSPPQNANVLEKITYVK